MPDSLRYVLVLALSVAIAWGCGNDSSSPGGNDGSGGNGGRGGTGGSPTLPKGEGLEINTGLGIAAIAEPLPGESNLHGSIFITRDEGITSDHEVSINGKALRSVSGLATPFEGETYPDVGPGKVLRIEAHEGGDSVTIEAPCPDVAIESPADGETIGAGEELEITWSGDPFAGDSTLFPILTIRVVDAQGRLETLPGTTQVSRGQSRAELRVPEAAVGREAYLVFTIPGERVAEANGVGGSHEASCVLHRRRRIEVVAP